MKDFEGREHQTNLGMMCATFHMVFTNGSACRHNHSAANRILLLEPNLSRLDGFVHICIVGLIRGAGLDQGGDDNVVLVAILSKL